MKKSIIFLALGTLLLVGCNETNYSSLDNQQNSSSSFVQLPDSSQNTPSSYDNPDDYGAYPQTIIVNEIRYDMVIDSTNSLNYELDQLIGHIINEDFLKTYKELYPNLIPVIENNFKCTDNKICIYTIKKANDSSEMKEYLAIKFRIVNVIKIEIFKQKEA